MQSKKLWITLLAFAMIALCGLMVLVVFFSFRNVSLPDVRTWNFQLAIPAVSATADETKTFPVSTPAILEVNNPFGDITVVGTDGKEIKVTTHKEAHGIDRKSAEENLKNLVINFTQDGNSVKIDVPEPEGRVINYTGVVFTIEVPRETAVTIDTKNGNVEASNLTGNSVLHSSFGSVTIDGLQNGSLTATSENGSVTATGIKSEGQPIELNSSFGQIKLTGATTSALTATSMNGEVSLSKVEVTGPVTVENEFGEVSVDDLSGQSMDVTAKNGGITLTGARIEKSLTVKNDFGDITLNNTLSGSYDLKNQNGSIKLDKAGGSVTASSDFGSIDISNGQACDINLTTSNGSISYEGSLSAGPHILKSDFGSIHLSLPSDSALTVDLETEFGEINNGFEITTAGNLKEHHQTGKINGGGAELNIKVDNGSITLEQTGK